MKIEFKEGCVAYHRGDYSAALEKWAPLAENGAAEAQVNLAILYAKGEGVESKTGARPRAGTASPPIRATSRPNTTSG